MWLSLLFWIPILLAGVWGYIDTGEGSGGTPATGRKLWNGMVSAGSVFVLLLIAFMLLGAAPGMLWMFTNGQR